MEQTSWSFCWRWLISAADWILSTDGCWPQLHKELSCIWLVYGLGAPFAHFIWEVWLAPVKIDPSFLAFLSWTTSNTRVSDPSTTTFLCFFLASRNRLIHMQVHVSPVGVTTASLLGIELGSCDRAHSAGHGKSPTGAISHSAVHSLLPNFRKTLPNKIAGLL